MSRGEAYTTVEKPVLGRTQISSEDQSGLPFKRKFSEA
mgnify:FL=1|jgi:hypothetical protein